MQDGKQIYSFKNLMKLLAKFLQHIIRIWKAKLKVNLQTKHMPSVASCSIFTFDALILDPSSRSDTYPVMRINESKVNIEHEATVSKVGEEQLFYLMSRGLTKAEAMNR